MFETAGKKGILFTSMLYVILPLLMAFKEYPLILPSELPIYLLGRVIVIFVSFVYLVLALLDKNLFHYPIALYFLGLAYAIHGQYFQPNYWLAMIELNALYPLVFVLRRRTVLILYGIGISSFNLAFYFFSSRFIQSGAFSEALRADIFIGLVITGIIALVTYNSLIIARIERTLLSQRFVDIGRNFSFIAHDLKGMVATPAIYASLLQKSFDLKPDSAKEKNLINQLIEDLNGIKVFVTEMNRLVTSEFSSESRQNFVKFSDSVQPVKMLLKSKLSLIRIVQDGDVEVQVKTEFLNRILINIISNSIEAFDKNISENSEIRITCGVDGIRITDNSGSRLSAQLLKKLNSSSISFTTKKQGSGLGTIIIKNDIANLGGRVEFTNGETGVLLRLTFPKGRLRPIDRSPPPTLHTMISEQEAERAK